MPFRQIGAIQKLFPELCLVPTLGVYFHIRRHQNFSDVVSGGFVAVEIDLPKGDTGYLTRPSNVLEFNYKMGTKRVLISARCVSHVPSGLLQGCGT